MQSSKIEWTNDTWNPWQGCKKISYGCVNCYMYRNKKRYGQNPGIIIRSAPATFNAPLTKLKGPLIFVCSWSDFFIEAADPWRDDAWDIMRSTPHLTYQILTKRPGLIADRLPKDWGDGWPNVWLGVSIEKQDYIYRLNQLTRIPAALRFVSYEPALGSIYIANFLQELSIDWVISGGESGPDYRPSHAEWFTRVREQCDDWGVPYFHKQNGGNKMIDGAWGGRWLDDRTHDEIPGNVLREC